MKRASLWSLVPALLGMILLLCLPGPAPAAAQTAWQAEDEVFYHIFVRSFRDSNGDQQGDLEGIREKLGYLKDLGVTSLLLTPINPSPFYHNYFGSSFEGVDPAYGDTAAFTSLVRAVHQRGMRIYLDQEIQYVVPQHIWWKDSQGNPGSRYGHFVLYNDSANTRPESAVFGIGVVPMWSGEKVGIASVNLLNPAVRDYFAELFAAMVDPNHDGKFEDGVDGFRIDHMMDDLDLKGKLPGLFANFWAPIFARVRAVNPNARIIAEQYDWGYGEDFLTRGGADLVFAFPIRGAIAGLKAPALTEALRETLKRTPPGKGQLVFIENHDTDRFASLVDGDPGKLRLGATLNVLLKGTPLIYYGQELGMRGRQYKAWGTDANDIPVREAFEWSRRVGSPGDALWYRRDDYPWWTGRYARDNDGVSAEEETQAPNSLLAWYRGLLALRKARPELVGGDQEVLDSGQPDVVLVRRSRGGQSSLLLANLGSAAACVSLPAGLDRRTRNLLEPASRPMAQGRCRPLPAFGVELLGQ
jgi:alpha-amylase